MSGKNVVGSIGTDRKPRERKSLAERIADLKAIRAAHLTRAEATEAKIRSLLAEKEREARAMLAAVSEAGETE